MTFIGRDFRAYPVSFVEGGTDLGLQLSSHPNTKQFISAFTSLSETLVL